MLARKCDFCGNFYEHYDGGGNNEERANAIMFIDRDTDNTHYGREIYDLCSDCMNKVLEMLKNVGK